MAQRLTLAAILAAALLAGCARPMHSRKDRVDAPSSSAGDGAGLGATAEPMTLSGGPLGGINAPLFGAAPVSTASSAVAVPASTKTTGQPVIPAKMQVAPSNITMTGGVVQSPADGAVCPDGKLEIKLSATDSKFYLAQIDADYTNLAKAGETLTVTTLPPGPHVLRVIACDEKGVTSMTAAQSVRTFTIGPKALPVPNFSPSAPIINIGRPFGTMKADDIGAVLMDIRVDGVKLSEAGTMLKYRLDNAPDTDAQVVTEYPPKRPVQLFGLDPGQHKLVAWLELDGKRIENGNVARVERTFTVAP